jgi:hypothetical protein
MNRNPSLGVAAAAAFSLVALSLFNCSVDPAELGGSGGISGGGNGGSSTGVSEDAAVSNAGGSGGPDAELVNIKLDVIPAWWGESDAWGPDTPSAPSVDSNCGITEKETSRQPVDILLVLDRSASLEYSLTEDCYCSNDVTIRGSLCDDTTNCQTRWSAVAPAVQTTVASSSFVNWGLKFFPSGNSTSMGAASCNVTQEIEVPVGPDAADAIQTRIDSATFSLGTPTTAAIETATAYLSGLSDSNDKVILLATDGEPNCKGGQVQTTDVDGASAACAAALEAGFPVYVIGMGPNLGNLSALAQAGGTNDYYPVNSPEQLAEALTAISKIVGSCTYVTDTEPEDPDNVAVYVNKQLIEKDAPDGWKYGASTNEILLTGSYCQDITDGKETKVQILFGCPGAPPFDPFLP